jgi:putative peptide zinc metalloprotease protein
MTAVRDCGVRELDHVRLRLRDGLTFRYDEFSGGPCYIVEDTIRSRFYRIGADEYYLISMLDGKITVGQAVAEMAKWRGPSAFTKQDAATICRWLLDEELASTEASEQPDRLLAATRAATNRRVVSRLNLLLIRIPVFNPDRLLDRILPWCGWLVSWPAFLAWVAMLTAGLYHMVAHGDRLAAATAGILAPGQWLALVVCWTGLKIIHELFHALAAKKFGGCVLECGIVLILFTPVPYVDATQSWRLSSKWQRIYTAAAGMYAELFCASVATLLWSFTPAGLLNDIAFRVILMAGTSTLLFNGNPLMRFDAYYMLADFLEIPNLSACGQKYWRYLGRRYLLAVPAQPPLWPPCKAPLIKLYGVLASAWRSFVLISLVIAAHALLGGAGLLVAAGGAIAWFGFSVARFVQYLAHGNAVEKPSVWRFLIRGGAVSALATVLIVAVPWPGLVSAPAVVQPDPWSIVRSEVPGFVQSIEVQNGQYVQAGQIVARLDNQELITELAELELQIEEIQRFRDQLQWEKKLPEAQIQSQYLEALRKRSAQKQDEVDRLIIRAPIDGQVVERNLASLIGTYVQPGAELLSVAGPGRALHVSIEQDDLDRFSCRIGAPVFLSLQDRPTPPLEGRIDRIHPHATQQLTSAALGAAAGGPLAVRSAWDSSHAGKPAEEAFQLISPRFQGTVKLSTASSGLLPTGQVVTVWFGSRDRSVGGYLYQSFVSWIRKKILQASL